MFLAFVIFAGFEFPVTVSVSCSLFVSVQVCLVLVEFLLIVVFLILSDHFVFSMLFMTIVFCFLTFSECSFFILISFSDFPNFTICS
jgi:hypothetical protein